MRRNFYTKNRPHFQCHVCVHDLRISKDRHNNGAVCFGHLKYCRQLSSVRSYTEEQRHEVCFETVTHLSIKMRNYTKLSAFIRLNAAAFIKFLVFRCGVYSRTTVFFWGKITFLMSLMRTITIIICRYNYVKEKHV